MPEAKPPETGEMYEVFGRQNERTPLTHLGSVRAPNSELAVAKARFVYSERPWVELCVAPSDAFQGCLKADQRGIVGMA